MTSPAKIKVSVKWQGKTFENLEIELSEPASVFKGQLFSLTGVEPSRQKILIKGGQLKDEADWRTLAIKEGQVLMMMGTPAEKVPEAPKERIQFVEDLSQPEINKAMAIPTGLRNLGNTCYMNATLQCLARIPELHDSLDKFQTVLGQDAEKNLVATMRDLFRMMRNHVDPFPPMVFLQTMRAAFPQFQQNTRGVYDQQDAEECFTGLVTALDHTLPPFVENYMSGKMEIKQVTRGPCMTILVMASSHRLTCDEAPDEPVSVTTERFSRVSCHISQNVNYLHQGFKEAMEEKIEKASPSLNRTAVYSKTSRISRLPKYLTVGFVRFFWKQEQRIKAKIMRSVKYPLDLDMYDFCTPALQEKLKPARDVLKQQDDAKAEHAKKRKLDASKGVEEDALDLKSLGIPTRSSLEGKVDADLFNDPAGNIHGRYDLVAVLTHIGRSADAGHYMAWVRNGDSDNWWKFDDDKVSEVKSDDILKLVGGGDWHIAYVCIYKSKQLA